MNALFAAAAEVSAFMAVQDWQFCLIGGLAVLRWGEPRLTRDADLTLLTGFGKEAKFAEALLDAFEPRHPDARAFALANRVLLIAASNGTPVDIAFGALPFEIEMMQRATPFAFAPGCVLTTCSAEDLFVMKAFANRPQDWIDARGIAIKQGTVLDRRYILRHLTALSELKEEPAILEQARRLLEPNA